MKCVLWEAVKWRPVGGRAAGTRSRLESEPTYVGDGFNPDWSLRRDTMKRANVERKTAVRCGDCQSIFTAEIEADGGVFLIGMGDRCGCGGTEFRSFA